MHEIYSTPSLAYFKGYHIFPLFLTHSHHLIMFEISVLMDEFAISSPLYVYHHLQAPVLLSLKASLGVWYIIYALISTYSICISVQFSLHAFLDLVTCLISDIDNTIYTWIMLLTCCMFIFCWWCFLSLFLFNVVFLLRIWVRVYSCCTSALLHVPGDPLQ